MQCYAPVWNGNYNVNCGLCYACLSNRRNEWTFRLMQEHRDSKISSFVTLTYDDENIIYGNTATLWKQDVQNYLKRVRKSNPHFHINEKGRKISDLKYYFVGEYGEKGGRPHYHGIVFNGENDILREKWKDKGYVHIGHVNQKSIHYVTKYVVNSWKNKDDGKQREFAMMSNGLGLGYIKRNRNYHLKNDVLHLTFPGGMKTKLFRYYKNKIWKNENETKRLAAVTLNNLDSYYLDLARQEQENKKFWLEFVNRRKNRTHLMNKFNKSTKI